MRDIKVINVAEYFNPFNTVGQPVSLFITKFVFIMFLDMKVISIHPILWLQVVSLCIK